jgi:hypothetical protein
MVGLNPGNQFFGVTYYVDGLYFGTIGGGGPGSGGGIPVVPSQEEVEDEEVETAQEDPTTPDTRPRKTCSKWRQRAWVRGVLNVTCTCYWAQMDFVVMDGVAYRQTAIYPTYYRANPTRGVLAVDMRGGANHDIEGGNQCVCSEPPGPENPCPPGLQYRP